MKTIIEYLNLIGSDSDKWVKNFQEADIEDKRCMIADLYGIFDSSIKGNIFTYYYWYSDVDISYIYNYTGERRKKMWRSVASCRRVDYNFVTDELKVTKLSRFNSRATENEGRKL